MTFHYNPPMEPYTDIMFHDDDILVANKQSGLLSVPGKEDQMKDCLETRVQRDFPTARPVHRLDMDTSGILVFALHLDALRHIGRQFENRETSKTYIALVDGIPKERSGTIDLPLICDWPNRPKQIVDHNVGKPSKTHYEIIAEEKGNTRVKLTPITGRSHQLRVHMQAIGHPILGDRFYANDAPTPKEPRLMLHAATLSFKHPATEALLSFTAETPF